jgi:hypothetical protein
MDDSVLLHARAAAAAAQFREEIQKGMIGEEEEKRRAGEWTMILTF